MPDTCYPKDIDTSIPIARLIRTFGSKYLRMWTADFPNAYETIGAGGSSNAVSCVRLANPSDNKPYLAKVLAPQVGSQGPPAISGRVVTFLKFPAIELACATTGFSATMYSARKRSAQNQAGSRVLNDYAFSQGPRSLKRGIGRRLREWCFLVDIPLCDTYVEASSLID